MSKYIDGFVLPIPTARLDEYKKIATHASKIWREHGALDYVEAVGEDMNVEHGMVPFPKLANLNPDETVVFAYIVYESRAHRDEVNAKVMADPRINEMCASGDYPFDHRRMAYGGFQAFVS